MILKFKDYDSTQAQLKSGSFVVDYKVKFYDNHRANQNSINGAKKVGRGKVQTWINSLSESELNKVRKDVQTMSQRKFKEAYNMTQVTVKKALGL